MPNPFRNSPDHYYGPSACYGISRAQRSHKGAVFETFPHAGMMLVVLIVYDVHLGMNLDYCEAITISLQVKFIPVLVRKIFDLILPRQRSLSLYGSHSPIWYFQVYTSYLMASRPFCLVLCSGHTEGVSAKSFIHAFTITNSVFVLDIATPQSLPVNFVDQDEGSRKWLADFKSKAYTAPIQIESIDPSKYSALLIPSAPGATHDLAKHDSVMHILRYFVKNKKPICAIGYGVCALAAARNEVNAWCFKGYSMTGPSVYDLVKRRDFSSLPIIFEEFARDNLASFTASQGDNVHTVIDRHLITGQNEQSTLSAVQNLLLLCNPQ